MSAPRQKRILFWVSICGVLALVISPFCVPIYVINKGKTAVRKANKAYKKAGLPMDWSEVAPPTVTDEVTPILRKVHSLLDFNIRRSKASSMKAHGLDADAVIKNTASRLRIDLYRARRSPSKRQSQMYLWDLNEEERQRLDEFCRYPDNAQAMEWLKQVMEHDTRNSSDVDEQEFQEMQYTSIEYLRFFWMHASLEASKDPSRIDELYELQLLALKLGDLSSQDHSNRGYLGRCGTMAQVVLSCMHYDRLHGTPPWMVDKIANWTDAEREKKVWLRHHDHIRLVEWPLHFELSQHAYLMDPEQMDLGPGLLGVSTTTPTTRIPYSRVLKTKQLPDSVRQPFAKAALNLTHAKNLEMLLPTRGVEPSHYVAAKNFHRQNFSRVEHRWTSGASYAAQENFIEMVEAYHMRLMWQEIYILGHAINRHADKHGELPATLEDLDPSLLKNIPTDRFPIGNSGPLIYKVSGETFELRSLGPNGDDDMGHFHYQYLKAYSGLNGEDYDDLAFTGRRTALPEPAGPQQR